MHKSSEHSEKTVFGMKMHPPLFRVPFFRTSGVCGHLHHRLFLYSAAYAGTERRNLK
nr:MAG TPA: hypothetical protein [Caudoviricetes sp.]